MPPAKLPKAHNYGLPDVPPPSEPAPTAADEVPITASEPAGETVASIALRLPAVAPRRRTEQFNVRIDGELHDRIKRYLARSGHTARDVTEALYSQFLDSMGEA